MEATNWHTSDTLQFIIVGSADGGADEVGLASILAFFTVGGDRSKASEVAGLFFTTASKFEGGLKALLPPEVGGRKLPLRAKFNNAWVEWMSIMPEKLQNLENLLTKNW